MCDHIIHGRSRMPIDTARQRVGTFVPRAMPFRDGALLFEVNAL